MREKYRAISSAVGAWRKKLLSDFADCVYAYEVSAKDPWFIVVATAGVEA